MGIDLKEAEEITDALMGDFNRVAPGSVGRDLLRFYVHEAMRRGREAIRWMPYWQFRECRRRL